MGELTVRLNLPVRSEDFGGIVGHGIEVCETCNNPVLVKIAYLVRGALSHIHYKEILLSCSNQIPETLILASFDEDQDVQESTAVLLKITQA